VFQTIGHTLELIRTSWKVLLQDRELIFFPLLSGLLTLAALAVFGAIAAATGTLERITKASSAGTGQQAVTPVDAVLGIVFLFTVFAIVIFFNSALIAGALQRLQGGDPTVSSGIRAGAAHLPQILAWSAISVVVSLILNALRERGGIGGVIASWIGGAAWGFATFFVIPVLVIEGTGPIEAIKRSSGLFSRTWGNQVAGSFGFGLVYLVAILIGTLISVAFFAISPVLGVVVAVPLIAAAFGIVQALEGIFKAALYQFAKGEAAAGFDQATLRGAYHAR
jgi:uncharacterized protein DUF6159